MRTWSMEWPTRTGKYWFYGWCWKSAAGNPEMHLVDVYANNTGVSYVTGGHFLYKSEGAYGRWTKSDLSYLSPDDLPVRDVEFYRGWGIVFYDGYGYVGFDHTVETYETKMCKDLEELHMQINKCEDSRAMRASF